MPLLQVIKETGEREPWNPAKLERSLLSAGADVALTRAIIDDVESTLRDGLRTSDIYQHAFELLKKHKRPVAAQYSLKRALAEFGPSGFPFERFVAALLDACGYRTQVGVMVPGACVTHEVDVVAENDKERILVEAKFHNAPDIRSDVKVALYVKARFDDIMQRYEKEEGGHGKFNRAWLITNTNFTSQAIKYGSCTGLLMTGWNYPRGRTLQDIVRETGVHPVTVLTTLSNSQKISLFNQGIVLCRDVLGDPEIVSKVGVPHAHTASVLNEAEALCAVSSSFSGAPGTASIFPPALPRT